MSQTIDSFRAALAADPDNWETRFGLIHALHQEGETHEAVDLLSGITALPTDDRSIIYAAQCYQVLGANPQAQSVYETALSLNPNNESAKAGLRSLGIEPDAPPAPVAAVPVEPVEDEGIAVAQPVPLHPPGEDEEEGTKTIALEEAVQANQQSATPAARALVDQGVPPPPIITKEDTTVYDPATAELVDHIHAAEEESKRRYEATVNRDRINSVIVTILVHAWIVMALLFTFQAIPRRVPPQIVASSSAETNDPALEQQVMKKNTLKSVTASQTSAADIVSIDSISAVSIASMDSFTGMDMPTETGMTFQPSLSMGMPSSSSSMMMFGQPLEGETLGVVLDVSGSMAEWLPRVIREVDKNFKDAPIVYINHAEVRTTRGEIEIRPIVKEEVKPRREDGTHTPFWFLWYDLPRKAPQRYVDRLIETFKTRPNQFIAVSQNGHWRGGDRLGAAMRFLAKENCDAVYVFSDFEDFIDEDVALEHGRHLAQSKVRCYIQPAVSESEFLTVMSRKVASRTKGRQLPVLESLIKKDGDDEPPPLVPPRPEEMMTHVPGTKYANPRATQIGTEWYHFKPRKGSTEITRYSEPEFDAVFYGPEARAAIFLKDKEGGYIQNPIIFGYHSWKHIPDHPDHAFRYRRRKLLRMEEPPTFDGKEIVWKMVLEDELKFHVHLYLDRKGMNATYVADPPTDDTSDGAYIYFSVPALARERKDLYYGQDLPPEGIKLDQVRQYCRPDKLVMNLPRQERDRYGTSWGQLGFEPGYNTRTFDTLITRMPSGIRDMKVSGPSFGPRIFHARTTSSKILLHGGAGRHDSEPWEGFHARLVRSKDRRTRFTKTEAIAIQIE